MSKHKKKTSSRQHTERTASDIPEHLVPYILNMTDPEEDRHLDPPGCYSDFLETPYPVYRDGRKGAFEVSVFYDHRCAFYYWMKWKRNKCRKHEIEQKDFEAPNLVSMDWHNDFGGFCDFDKDSIQSLNQASNLGEIALFTWLGLRALNDGHILPALWLNAIGDVYLITKQKGQKKEIRCIEDCFGNPHRVHYVKSLNEFARRWEQSDYDSQSRQIYWDIDLDYFTKGDQLNGPIMSEKEICKMFSAGEDGIRIILSAIDGLTFALEPHYSRGLVTALKFYSIWEKIFIKGNISPFGNYGWRSKYSQ